MSVLSLIVPMFNEEARIRGALGQFAAFLPSAPIQTEVLLVDDGSTDGTPCIVAEFIAANPALPLRHIVLPGNAGKGAAIREGLRCANGEIVGFTDADLPFGLEIFSQVHTQFLEDPALALVIGDREDPRSSLQARPGLHRRIAGRAYSFLIAGVLGLGIADTQCGLKFMRAAFAGEIARRCTINGFGFDVELLAIARKNGLKIAQIPVTLQASEGSSVRVVRDAVRMFRELLRVRLNAWRGYYSFGEAQQTIPGGYQQEKLLQGHAAQRAWHRNRMDTFRSVALASVGGRALDVGVGSGLSFGAAGDSPVSICGIDISVASLGFAAASFPRAKGRLCAASGDKLPFQDGAFTDIWCQEVLEHIPPDVLGQVLSEFHRVLAPGGRLFITTPNYRSAWPLIEFVMDTFALAPRMGGDQHVNKPHPQMMARALRGAGFQLRSQGTFNLLSPWAGAFSTALAARLHALEMRHAGTLGSLLYCLSVKPHVASN